MTNLEFLHELGVRTLYLMVRRAIGSRSIAAIGHL